MNIEAFRHADARYVRECLDRGVWPGPRPPVGHFGRTFIGAQTVSLVHGKDEVVVWTLGHGWRTTDPLVADIVVQGVREGVGTAIIAERAKRGIDLSHEETLALGRILAGGAAAAAGSVAAGIVVVALAVALATCVLAPLLGIAAAVGWI